MYAIVARTAQRARQVVALMLITVQGPDGGRAPEGEALAEAMDDLKLAIAGTLRKSDTFTKYSRASMRCCCPWESAGRHGCRGAPPFRRVRKRAHPGRRISGIPRNGLGGTVRLNVGSRTGPA